MSDHLPIEALRPGGAPSTWPAEPGPDVEWSPYDEDGELKVSSMGGGAMIFARASVRHCSRCDVDIVAQFWARHQEREHPRE